MPEREILALTQVAVSLAEKVATIGYDSHAALRELADLTRKTRRHARMFMVAVIVGVLLIITNAFLVIRQERNVAETDALVTRLNTAQGVQRQESLCPLYQLFIDAEKFPEPLTDTDEQRASRLHAFVIIHKSYDRLKCGDFDAAAILPPN